MKTEINMNQYTNKPGHPAGAGILQGPPQQLAQWRLRFARAARASFAAGLFLVATGCATSNFNFDELSEASDSLRAERLGEALALEKEDGNLYDVNVTPLLHTHLNVFARTDEEGIPAGFVEADIDAYFPFFGFVDATVNRYDNDHQLYEGHEWDSYLWGLFQTHREQIATKVGLREKKTRRFLWFFSWRSSPEYVDVAPQKRESARPRVSSASLFLPWTCRIPDRVRSTQRCVLLASQDEAGVGA